jgi:hypothetical protein
MDLSADNAEPFFKTLLKSVALAPTGRQMNRLQKARLTSSNALWCHPEELFTSYLQR